MRTQPIRSKGNSITPRITDATEAGMLSDPRDVTSPMAYLSFVLCLLCNVCFGQTLRLGQKLNANVHGISGVNYAVGAVASIAGFLLFTPQPWEAFRGGGPVLIGAALINGVCYFLNMCLLLAGFRMAGVGVTIAVSNAGVLLSMLASWLIWNEPMTFTRWLAAAMIVPAMFLLRPPDTAHAKFTWRADLLLAALFMMNGIILIVLKWAKEDIPADSMRAFQAMLFSVAAVVSCGYVAWQRVPLRRVELSAGVMLGLFNAGATLFILMGLAYMPAVALFPALSCMSIVCNAGAACLLWKERLTLRQIAGMVIAMSIVVLVYVPDWMK